MPKAGSRRRKKSSGSFVSHKLMHQYGYQADEIDLEKGVQFGTEIGTVQGG